VSRVPKSVREKVRERAEKRCEYCRKPEEAADYPHHVDHIIPLRHGGSSALDNLAWACFQCNTAKIRDIASFDLETRQLVLFYNPRTQKWNDYFEMDGAIINGKTPIGRVTVRLLQMNTPSQVGTRQRLINADLW
jgi:HNH endonuclease